MSADRIQRYSVHVVGETDDFDGVSRIGMAYRNWSGAVHVLMDDGAAGWWDGHYTPYLVFSAAHAPRSRRLRQRYGRLSWMEEYRSATALSPSLPSCQRLRRTWMCHSLTKTVSRKWPVMAWSGDGFSPT